MAIDVQEVKEKLYASVISDVLDDMGLTRQVMGADIRPLTPDGMIFGRVRTMLAVPIFTSLPEPYERQIEATDALSEGDVVVAHTSNVVSSAFWGELFSTAAYARGAVGAVIDGFARDYRLIEHTSFPVFCRGLYPVNSKGRLVVSDYDVPITCGGVKVKPGDFIFAEMDGVVVIPGEIFDDVISKALTISGKENAMRADLLRGSALGTAWRNHGVL